jgi:UDP-N-acetylmuramoyl-tripeptide--D-alanyl-D-alanine ligase
MMRGFFSIFSWRYPTTMVGLLQKHNYRVRPYLQTYWQTNNFAELGETVSFGTAGLGNPLRIFMYLGSLAQIALGVLLIIQWDRLQRDGWWAFGLALIISYPVVWAHMIVFGVWLNYVVHPKKMGRAIICTMLEGQAIRLRRKHDFKVVAVVGSVGKTSTKAAIAKTLEASKRVIWQEGNYNDRVTVPLVLFNQPLPGLLNVPAWLQIWRNNERVIRSDYPYDIAVVEFGVDGPGQMEDFAYLKPDVTIVTAITPEHMEYFGTLDAVAQEELTALSFSKKTLINTDDTPEQYLKKRTYTSYGLEASATYNVAKRTSKGLDGQKVTFKLGKSHTFTSTIPMLGAQGAKIATAAAATAHLLGETHDDIEKGLKNVEAFAGRMRLFKGIKESVLIDDTYNSSPIATNAALDVLYETKAKQRIAVLGSMNELGDYSPEAHHEVGVHCDPKKVDLVVTIGHDAEVFLAPVAREQGCEVHSFKSPYKAGTFIKKQLKEGAVVLGKGSQNGVFAEETLKMLLADKKDIERMVRQSPYWLAAKRKQFPDAR